MNSREKTRYSEVFSSPHIPTAMGKDKSLKAKKETKVVETKPSKSDLKKAAKEKAKGSVVAPKESPAVNSTKVNRVSRHRTTAPADLRHRRAKENRSRSSSRRRRLPKVPARNRPRILQKMKRPQPQRRTERRP